MQENIPIENQFETTDTEVGDEILFRNDHVC